MPVYKVIHTATVTYEALVAAPNEETALGGDSYAEVVENQPASEHAWHDSTIVEEYDAGAVEPDYCVGVDAYDYLLF